jgi:hypothetical protein
MFMISSSAFIALPRWVGRALLARSPEAERITGTAGRDTDRGDVVAVGGEFWWPSVGRSVAACGEFLMAADTRRSAALGWSASCRS